jgi:predicted amidophosphoribosyltransferase
VTTIACPHCHKPIESGQTTYCPHCYLRLPGVSRTPPAAVKPVSHTPRLARAKEVHGGTRRPAEARPRTRTEPEAKPAGQCPACAHPITTRDQWCKWCHWPVNRKV